MYRKHEAIRDSNLSQEFADVCFYRTFSDSERSSDFLVGAALDCKRSSNPPSQAAEPVVKCGYGLSDERSHGKTTDTGRDSADCVGVCDERHATE